MRERRRVWNLEGIFGYVDKRVVLVSMDEIVFLDRHQRDHIVLVEGDRFQYYMVYTRIRLRDIKYMTYQLWSI
jgi:hypothetical protein